MADTPLIIPGEMVLPAQQDDTPSGDPELVAAFQILLDNPGGLTALRDALKRRGLHVSSIQPNHIHQWR